MYLSVFHAIAIFIISTLAISAYIYMCYRYFKSPKSELDTKRLVAFGCINTAAYLIILIGTLMGLDSALKSSELRNFKSANLGDEIGISALIYNKGKVAFKYCTLRVRQINTAPKSVDGSIFAPRWFDAHKLDKPKSSYEYKFYYSQITEPINSFSINERIPKVFSSYKLRAYISCN